MIIPLETAQEIRRLHIEEKLFAEELGLRFNLSGKSVRRILRNEVNKDPSYDPERDYKTKPKTFEDRSSQDQHINKKLKLCFLRAKKEGTPFDPTLTYEDLKPYPSYCPVLGLELNYETSKLGIGLRKDSAVSLDQLIPGKGYVEGNIFIISWRANHLKNNGTLEEFQALVKWMESLYI